MVNVAEVKNRLKAILTKQTIAEFINDQEMMDAVKKAKTELISEVAFNDPVIRARFNYLFQ